MCVPEARLAVAPPVALLAAVPASVLVVVLLIPGLLRGPTLDASVFAQIGEQLRAGAMPYRDLFDHKPPGIYLVEAAAGSILPFIDAWPRAWVVTVVATLGSFALLVWRLAPCRPIGTALALAAVTPIVAAHHFAQGGGYTESLAILPAITGLLLATADRRASTRTAFVAGLLLGSAAAVSLQLLPAGLAVLTATIRGGSRTAIASYVAGALAVALVVAAWLALGGALSAAFEQLVVYNRAYLAGRSSLDLVTLQASAFQVLMCGPALAAAVARLAHVARTRAVDEIEVASAVWILAWVASLVFQGQISGHYTIAIAAPLAVLAVPVFDRLGDWLREPRTRLLALVAATLSIALPVATTPLTEPGPSRSPEVAAAAVAVERVTPDGAPVFVWGNEPFVYLLTDRRPVGRYVYMFPLTNVAYTTDVHVAELLSDWTDTPPAAIVDASYHPRGVGAHPLLGRWRYRGEPVPDRLDPLRDFVRMRYHMETTAHGWPIYVPN